MVATMSVNVSPSTLFAPAATPPALAPASAHRDAIPGQGWTEPERRKFRLRLEDVAFD